MKPLKTQRMVKSPTRRSPGKKIQAPRKQGPYRSPQHFVSNRSVSGNISGSMKQSEMSSLLPSRSSKPSHLSRSHAFTPPQRLPPRKSHHPALSFDRARGPKRSYEKKQFSHSPIERRITESSRMLLPRSKSPHIHVSQYGSMPKKTRREETHFGQSPPIPRYLPNSRSREKNRLSRSENETVRHDPVSSTSSAYGYDDKKYMVASTKEKSVYGTVQDGYEAAHLSSHQIPREKVVMNADMVYHPREYSGGKRGKPETYVLDKNKSYGLTLDERFRAVSCDSARARAEQHTQYSKEELENITIDIKRSMREYSPTVRRIIDPTEVKLVRRPEEGHNPIFEREEIRQASRDLREDAHFEQKMYSSRVSGHYVFNHKDMENYEITRHKFDTYRGPTLHMDGLYTLTEKWQRLENKKNEMTGVEREERGRSYYDQQQNVGDFAKKYRSTRSASADRDFRIGSDNRSRTAYESDMHKAMPSVMNDTRYKESSSFFSHDDRQDAHRRGNSNRGNPETLSRPWYSGLQRHPADILGHDRGDKDVHECGRDPREPWINEHYYDRARAKEEKVTSLVPQKSSRSKYNLYLDKSSEMPRASSFQKYDDREGPKHPKHFGTRGSFRGFRTKTSRGRLSKAGTSRGFRGRYSYQGPSSSRGRGFPSRRRMLSGSYPMD